MESGKCVREMALFALGSTLPTGIGPSLNSRMMLERDWRALG
jgi:hypothetical protein